ncbi:MAG: hypothetical protein AAGI54_13605 [Planctomycetota bacterium]
MIERQVLTYPGVVERLGRWLASRIVWVWVALVVVYAAGFTGQWLPGPDTATHVLLAEALAGDGRLDHPENALRKIEPGLAHLMNALGGVGWVLQAGMIAMSLATLAMWWWAVRLAAGREIAAGTLVLLALCECVYRYAFQALTDIPFAASVAAVVLGYQLLARSEQAKEQGASKAKWWLARRVGGVALLMAGMAWGSAFRSVWLVVLAAVLTAWVIDLWRGKRYRGLAVLGGFALLGVVAVGALIPLGHDESMMWSRVTSELPTTLWQLATVNLPRLLGESVSEAMIAVDAGWWLAVPVTVVGLAGAVGLAWRTRQTLWLTLLAWFVVQWLLFLVVDRYALPVLAILAAGWWWAALSIERWVALRRDRPAGAAVALVLLALWVVPNAVAMSHVLRQFRDDPYREGSRHDGGRYAGMRPAADWLADHGAGPGDAAILNRTRAASDVWAVHTGLTTYDGNRQGRWAEHEVLWVVAPIDQGPGRLRGVARIELIDTIHASVGVWRVTRAREGG